MSIEANIMHDHTTTKKIRFRGSRVNDFARMMDAIIVMGSFWLVRMIYAGSWHEPHSLAIAWAVILFFFAGQAHDLYSSTRVTTIRQTSVKIWLSWLSTILGLLLLAYAFGKTGFCNRFEAYGNTDRLSADLDHLG